MNFYVPIPRLNEKADLLVLMFEERLAAAGRAVTRRRIRALVWDDGEQEELILVGASLRDCQDGEDCPVLLILEDADEPDLIHIVTLEQAAVEGMPRSLRLDPLWRIVDFDDSPGHDGEDGEDRRVRA